MRASLVPRLSLTVFFSILLGKYGRIIKPKNPEIVHKIGGGKNTATESLGNNDALMTKFQVKTPKSGMGMADSRYFACPTGPSQ